MKLTHAEKSVQVQAALTARRVRMAKRNLTRRQQWQARLARQEQRRKERDEQ